MKLERNWIVRHFSELLHLHFSKLERRTETGDLVFLKNPKITDSQGLENINASYPSRTKEEQ